MPASRERSRPTAVAQALLDQPGDDLLTTRAEGAFLLLIVEQPAGVGADRVVSWAAQAGAATSTSARRIGVTAAQSWPDRQARSRSWRARLLSDQRSHPDEDCLDCREALIHGVEAHLGRTDPRFQPDEPGFEGVHAQAQVAQLVEYLRLLSQQQIPLHPLVVAHAASPSTPRARILRPVSG